MQLTVSLFRAFFFRFEPKYYQKPSICFQANSIIIIRFSLRLHRPVRGNERDLVQTCLDPAAILNPK